MYESIPSELKLVKNWVCWCGDKLPKNPYTGGNAQSNRLGDIFKMLWTL